MRNKIIIHGYLGRDPELKEVQGQNGTFKKATFTLGVSRDFGDQTDWFFCTINGRKAEVLEKHCKKGSQLIVEGRMESYKPRNDPDRTAWLVNASDFDFCDRAGTRPQGEQGENVAETFEEIEEDVPF